MVRVLLAPLTPCSCGVRCSGAVVTTTVLASAVLAGAATAGAATTSPFDPSGSGATQGTISFYDSAGQQVTGGLIAEGPAFAVADTDSGRPGDLAGTTTAVVPGSFGAWMDSGDGYPAIYPRPR